MTSSILCWMSIFAVAAAAVPVCSGAMAKDVLPIASSAETFAEGDCESKIRKLDRSQAEGEERLAEKQSAVAFCAGQYRNDKAIEALANECAKYEEQPVLKQQFVAECQLAAFNYANALYALRAEYGK